MTRIEAVDDGKVYTLVTIGLNNTLITTQGKLTYTTFPYVVIDGMVWHSRVYRKCRNCFEHYWAPLNERWEEFLKGWVVNEL